MEGHHESPYLVSIDSIDEDGSAIHYPDDGLEPLKLGAMPPELLNEEVTAERWAPNQASVVDKRFQLSPAGTYTPPNTALENRLNTQNLTLDAGDHVCGITTDSNTLRIGSYRITLPDTPPDELVIARITESNQKKFGANTATAERRDKPSAFAASIVGGVGLKTLTAADIWTPPNLSPLEQHLIGRTATLTRESESVSLFSPGYHPYLGLQLAIELLYHAPSASNVVLYTPGSQVQWGTKGDIRDIYEHIGISADVGDTEDALPFANIYPHAYIHNGTIQSKQNALFESQLVLTKSLTELPADAEYEVIIADWTSRQKPNDTETLDDLRSQHSNTPFVTITSPFSKRERDGYPAYSPIAPHPESAIVPDATAVTDVLDKYRPQVSRSRPGVYDTETLPRQVGGSPLPASTADFLGHRRVDYISLKPVDSGSIGHFLDMALEKFDELHDNNLPGAAGKIYSAEMFFERLPVPPKHHDDWIRDRYDENPYYLPDPIPVVIDDLESFGENIDAMQAPASIFGAVKALRKVESKLNDTNPLYQHILEAAQKALEADTRIGVFCQRKTHIGMLEGALIADGIPEFAIGDRVILADSDTIRDLPTCQTLLIPGPQRQQDAGYMLHPRAEEIRILTYDGGWMNTMQKYITNYVERLNAAIDGPDDKPYPIPRLEFTSDSYLTSQSDDDATGLRIQYPDGSSDDVSTPTEPRQEGPAQSTTGGEDNEAIPENPSESDLDTTACNRLVDVVRLAPTNNSELAAEWGMESGSEVYQYLSTALTDYYKRNDAKRIVPTEDGEALARRFEQMR